MPATFASWLTASTIGAPLSSVDADGTARKSFSIQKTVHVDSVDSIVSVHVSALFQTNAVSYDQKGVTVCVRIPSLLNVLTVRSFTKLFGSK